MRSSLIIAAGGSGSRFRESCKHSDPKTGREVSKIFLPLGGKPLLARTVAAFSEDPRIREILIALPPSEFARVRELEKRYGWKKTVLVEGGKSRAESVYNALRKTSPRMEWVLVHDGARPLVQPAAVNKLMDSAAGTDGAILAQKVVPTLKEVDEKGRILRTVDRSHLYEAQTPQLVRRKLLMDAYRLNPGAMNATDEASLVEFLGADLKIVSHECWNPKITTLRDFELAETFLSGRGEIRTGFGRDLHRLVPGRKFWLGGLRIPSAAGALGHSDGDALLHALSDAILGVTGAGDIGDWFSDQDRRYRNIQSSKILAAVLSDAQKRGWKILHADTVISLERPKLGAWKEKIRLRLARLLGLEPDAVSVKAKTMEGLGPVGEGLAISCEAVVTARKVSS